MRTLIINTYAGSLLLGANAIKGSNIIGSFEDVGFGAEVTKANRERFTEATADFAFVDSIKHWPDLDLSDVIVLAHPPCAAFSQQNTSKSKRGTETDAFECTRKVLHYAMGCNAAAIAVESVPGALAGAWDVHEHMAEAGGYHIYRVLKNSVLFGVPQFRERFWAVFVRKGIANPEFTWKLSPRITTVATVLDPLMPGEQLDGLEASVQKFITKLVKEHGFDEQEVRNVGLAEIGGVKRMGFARLIQPVFFPKLTPQFVLRNYISKFSSSQPSVLAPGCFTSVLLGTSLWVYKGRVVPAEGYKAIMGFPPDYIFPPDRSHGVRTFLSKGVCPPVATWILDNIRQHIFQAAQGSEFTGPGGYLKTIIPGKIVSFKPGRNTLLEHLEEMQSIGCPESDELIELRDDRDDGDEED